MKRYLVLVIIFFGFLGCQKKTSKMITPESQPNNTSKSSNITKEMLDQIPIWPKCELQSKYVASLDEFKTRWYNQQLKAMQEPLLGLEVQCDDYVRFIWLRTFHNPVVVSFYSCKGKNILRWKVLDGAGGYDPGQIKISKERELSIEEWNKVQEILDDMEFWRLYTEDPSNRGFDGAQWIIEGKCEKYYHIVDRWTPSKNNSFRQGCLKLLAFTDISVSDDEIY
jgi:hypothetical protein